ncbi:hypothetical protein Acr_14g0009580 [Actinidia rufa]|uniref:Late embryogenesis abundant (LEA) hydroxyproline-rich glycoprotein family n=1 Tax=Actinidia rufa TaxID=165716 RepID=A0A7J0FRI5_9ERIC|nr:hypothetical protein Acr_14g0009580 [Actinidia rufa]
MEEENQIQPLAPATIYGKSDEEFANLKPINNRVPRPSSKWPVYVLAGIVFQGMVILVFCTAVLRVETPKVRLHAVAVKSLEYTESPSALLNATMLAEMSVNNNNFGRFRFEDSTVAVLYGNVTVGGGGSAAGGQGRGKTSGGT